MPRVSICMIFEVSDGTFSILGACGPMGFPGGASGKESACQCRRHQRHRFSPWAGKIPQKKMATHSSILVWRIPMDRGAW